MKLQRLPVVCVTYLILHFGLSHPPEEAFMDTPGLISHYGYRHEAHRIMGLDGHILTYFRIPHGRYFRGVGEVVIIHHALLLSSREWFIQENPWNNLPFLLADAGYDVWIANARGTDYSKGHITLDSDDPEFWNFSFHEIGAYDHPAVVNYILRATGKSQVSYIGHSMGCTSFIVFLTERPEFNAVIRKVIFMAPAAYMQHIASPMKALKLIPEDLVMALEYRLNRGRVLPPKLTYLVRKLGPHLCTFVPGKSWKSCMAIIFSILGFNFAGASEVTMAISVGGMPSESALKIVQHYKQWFKKPYMRQYDYGEEDNMLLYGSPEPPPYLPQNIKVPTMVMWGANDLLTEPEDTVRLIHELDDAHSVLIEDPKFNHLDFAFSHRAPELVYGHVISFLR